MPQNTDSPRHILITGSSSGLGAALALAYAAPGITLSLCARRADALAQVAAQATAQGACVHTRNLDVNDAAALQDWIRARDADTPLDLVIANAGVSGGTARMEEDRDKIHALFATNFNGALNTIEPARALMAARGRGQIALISSIASFFGLTGAPAYSASKGALRLYGEALRAPLARKGVGITVICPGFIETPMTDVNDFPMPFLMSAARAARIIQRALPRNPARLVFPWPMAWAVKLGLIAPFNWIAAVIARLPAKP